ncbi:MAG: endonuclease/exonuclease/phosphatase family protein [Pseudomonadota bacterium]
MRLALLVALLATTGALADTLRVATFNASLSRSAPGLLVADLIDGDDPQIGAVVATVAEVAPDILLLNEVDYDAGGLAAGLLQEALSSAGIDFPHRFLAPVNAGVPSGLDINGDGDPTGPADAFGYGRFPGQYGMLVLSRFPIDADGSATFQTLLWRDLPGASLPEVEGEPFPSAAAHEAMRLSSKSHWDILVEAPGQPVRLLASHPTPPVFDGPEDLNGLRNRDEVRLWTLYLDGHTLAADHGPHRWDGTPVIVLGDLNADPIDGDGRHEAIEALLTHREVQDPQPESAGALAAAAADGGRNARHLGDPAHDTADWNDDRGPGNLRADYVLPSAAFTVTGAGVFWPAPDQSGAELLDASDHRLVWVDLDIE